jgi:hypothetical protein
LDRAPPTLYGAYAAAHCFYSFSADCCAIACQAVDETWLKTNMAKRTGWAPRGQRLVDYAPFWPLAPQTFVAALRHDRLDAPWVLNGPPLSRM